MTPQYLTMVGLVLDIAGGFLVAVEAIKIENLRILRDKVLNRTNSYILGPRIAPQYVMDDADVKSNIENSQKNELNEPLPAMGCLPLLTLHVVVGFTPLFLIDKFTIGIVSTTCLTEISRLSWSLKILFISIAVIVGVPLMGAIGSGMFSAFSITQRV